MQIARNILYQVFSLLYFLVGFGQKIPLEEVGYLDKALEECSGIAYLPSGHVAMINDSGNHPDIFFTTLEGTIVRKQCLGEITNHDWEGLTYAEGYLYIGDFGNNRNERKDLAIYKYSVDSRDSLHYQGDIRFRYADQVDFPPASEYLNYDLEALVHVQDSIFIFTKNRTKPFSGYTYQYGMPDKPGTYNLSKIDSFRTGFGKEEYFWISGAALSPESNTLALLGYDKLWIFHNYKGTRFFSGQKKVHGIGFLSQKEAITFAGERQIIITDEKNLFGGGKVYHALIPPNEKLKQESPGTQTAVDLKIPNKDFKDTIVVIFPEGYQGRVLWEIYTTHGNRALAGNNTLKQGQRLLIEASALEPGGYVLNVIVEQVPHAFKLRKLIPLKNDN